ncbi:MAG TPA: hypothetical protein VJS11_14490 [Acidobacteriaceae bacterium]|nr:hypothetical protein [Acidobacteriaceae bacterium]
MPNPPPPMDINIPGNPNATVVVGQELRIHWASACSFCITKGSANDFTPALPNGQSQSPPYFWTGTANQTGTVEFDTPAVCGRKPTAGGGGGTITIGSSMPAKR